MHIFSCKLDSYGILCPLGSGTKDILGLGCDVSGQGLRFFVFLSRYPLQGPFPFEYFLKQDKVRQLNRNCYY